MSRFGAMMFISTLLLLLMLLQPFSAIGFTFHQPSLFLNTRLGSLQRGRKRPQEYGFATRHVPKQSRTITRTTSSSTRLYVLFDVPDNFFTVLLPTLSLFLAFSKAVARSRLEERAWEQRLEESRQIQLERDSSLTELELRKREAAAEWSAYGNNDNNKEEWNSGGGKRRVTTRERDSVNDDDDEKREFNMSPEEVMDFEQEFGVDYDPYYDDPYTEDELPEDVPYKVDKLYGDRIYKDGEVFYKDDKSGLYYRQGAQPRTQKFW